MSTSGHTHTHTHSTYREWGEREQKQNMYVHLCVYSSISYNLKWSLYELKFRF